MERPPAVVLTGSNVALAIRHLSDAEAHLRLAAVTDSEADRVRRLEWAARLAGFRRMMEGQERTT